MNEGLVYKVFVLLVNKTAHACVILAQVAIVIDCRMEIHSQVLILKLGHLRTTFSSK
jgi:hypothetical protein